MLHLLKKTGTFLVGSLTGVAMFFVAYGGAPLLFAQQIPGSNTSTSAVDALSGASATTNVTQPANSIDSACHTQLSGIFEKEKSKFITFMNTHFKNEAPNSQLLQTGLDELNNYRSRLTAARNSFMLQSKLQSSAITEIAYCNKQLEEQLKIAETVFQSYVEQVAYSKKSTALTEKINGINSKLGNLLTLLSQLDSYFTSFSNKLPGFVQNCVKSGTGK